MSLYLRLLWVLVTALLKPALPLIGISRLRLRAWPNDLDVNGHVNNGRLMTLADLGRVDIAIRTGLPPLMMRRGWRPVMAGALARFSRPLRVFQRFELLSRVVGWDDRWIYMEHVLRRQRDVIAVVAARTLLVAHGQAVPTAEVSRALKFEGASPALPSWVADWQTCDARLWATAVQLPVSDPVATDVLSA